MLKFAQIAAAVIVCAVVHTAQAQLVQSFGAGSAVTVTHASAFFEIRNALTANPYVENALQIPRTGLSFNNNGCGVAGCTSVRRFAAFEGHFMFGEGVDGYFTIKANVSTVPEPGSWAMMAIGLILIALMARRWPIPSSAVSLFR